MSREAVSHSSGLSELTIAEAGRLLARRHVSPVELADESLKRIERANPALNAFITIAGAVARDGARRAEKRIAEGGYKGGIDGIPFALKDNIDTAGVRSTSHSKLLHDNVPERDAAIAAKLAGAGGILAGKTATFEFALGGPSWDLPWPPAGNPWSLDHLPGGSSSGSAAAVAARLVPFAMGTDTGGSVRWPAASCGIVGLKPTYGRVSRRGVHPNTFSIDHCGPMTRTVEDCAIVLNAVAGHDPLDPGSIDEPVPDYTRALSGSVKGIRMGLVRNWYESDSSPDVVRAVDSAAAHLSGLGAIVEEIDLGPIIDYTDCKSIISFAELFSIHEEDLRKRPQDFAESTRTRMIAGCLVRGEDYVQALRWRTELTTKMLAKFTRFDVFLTAGWHKAADANDPLAPDFLKRRELITLPFSLTGIPALVLPCGLSDDGLPLSLQIAGKPFDEATVLRVGDAYQRSTAWHFRRPAMTYLGEQR